MNKAQHLTAVWRNGGCSASYDSFVVGSSAVLRLNFCAKIRHYAKPQTVIGNPNERQCYYWADEQKSEQTKPTHHPTIFVTLR